MKSKKKMKTNFHTLAALLLASFAVFSCSKDNKNTNPETQAAPVEVKTYTMTVEANKGGETRALADGGTTLTSTWTAGDKVKVYNSSDTELGELTAQASGASTTLSGTLTTLPSNGETLTLKYLSADYNSQDGTLTGTESSIDKVCDYSTASVTATVVGDNVTTTTASFQNQQAVVKFTLIDKADGTSKLNPTALTVSYGTNTVSLTSIPAATYTANGDGVLYVAIPGFSGETVSLSATVGSDTYTYEKASVTFADGSFYRITVKMTKQGGALSGQFSVSATKKVYFSKGNLQYDGTNWKFAEHQYDYIGSATGYPMDLFTWGNTANPTYNGTGYYTENANLSGSTDWGSNIGEGWYTLSTDEWVYLFQTRTDAASKYGYATVADKHGIIILPDDFTDPMKNNGSGAFVGSSTTGWSANVYSEDNWSAMESAGALFLPAACYRYGVSVHDAGALGYYCGYYWSSTAYDEKNYACLVGFYSDFLYAGYDYRDFGQSVRLVRQAEIHTATTAETYFEGKRVFAKPVE